MVAPTLGGLMSPYTGPRRRKGEQARDILNLVIGVGIMAVCLYLLHHEVTAGHDHPWHLVALGVGWFAGLVLAFEQQALELMAFVRDVATIIRTGTRSGNEEG